MPTLLIDTAAKVATPLTTVAWPPPVRVPVFGLVPIASVTLVVLSVVTTLPFASSTATVSGGAIASPASAVVGCWV